MALEMSYELWWKSESYTEMGGLTSIAYEFMSNLISPRAIHSENITHADT